MEIVKMSEHEMLMDLVGMEEWELPELTSDYSDELWDREF